MKVLFISKDRDDVYIKRAIAFVKANFDDSTVVLAKPGQTIADEVLKWQGDLLISYLCPWVLPKEVLQSAVYASINFHPATPDYPGTGCTNFAIYDGVKEYGAMCHHMSCKVDNGRVIAVKRFPVLSEDSVYSLTQKCYVAMSELFFEIMDMILKGKKLPESNEHWTRKPYTRAQLNALKKLDVTMSVDEIRRRVKATTYPGTPGAYFEIEDMKFEYVPQHDD